MQFVCDSCSDHVSVDDVVIECKNCAIDHICDHELVSIRNKAIDSGFMCVNCNRLFKEYTGQE